MSGRATTIGFLLAFGTAALAGSPLIPERWHWYLVALGLLLYASALAVAYLFSDRRKVNAAARAVVLEIEGRPTTDEDTLEEVQRAERAEMAGYETVLSAYRAALNKAKPIQDARLYRVVFPLLRVLHRMGRLTQAASEGIDRFVRRGYRDFHSEAYGRRNLSTTLRHSSWLISDPWAARIGAGRAG